MSKKPIKSSLFRFVTLRSPQVPEDTDVSFVSFDPSNESSSIYYQAISGTTDETVRQTALENTTPSSTLINSRKALKSLKPDLYIFSLWLMKNKGKLTYNSTSTALSSLLDGSNATFSLSDAEEVQIWDNLIYQTLNKQSVSLRENLIKMLIANQFAKAFDELNTVKTATGGENVFNEEEKQEFSKRANASIIIDKELVLSQELQGVAPSSGISRTTTTRLQNELELMRTQDRINSLSNTLIELEREEEDYNIENEISRQQYITSYKGNVDTAIAGATKTMVDVINPTTQLTEQVEVYQDLTLPKFDYTPLPIDFVDETNSYSKTNTGESKLSEDTKSILKETEFSSYSEFSTIKDALRESLNKAEEALITFPSVPRATGYTDNIGTYCFSGDFERLFFQQVGSSLGTYTIFVNIVTNRDNSSASSVSYSLTRNSTGDVFTGLPADFVNNADQRLVYRMSVNMSDDDFNVGIYTFNASMTFENGDEVDFEADIVVTKDAFQNPFKAVIKFDGCGDLQNGQTPTPVVSENPLNGIINLGVADFRRVEQEVCCYVPGEVSHIENIMKGESKERTNKVLKRTENTFTLENERTTEQLKDTTSTDRYEMNQETSEIVSQDSSFDVGVTFNTSGLNTSLSINSNYATATSTTESNQQAVSYAKDVTERALERITERVREERVSKIIEEYQEENKHSLDNSNGSTHSVGLYRWVDKVYKNQVANYGKRLMYEFNIPQPAAYYLTQKEKEYTPPTGLIEPADPRAEKLPNDVLNPKRLISPKSLDLMHDKYSYWASRYNISLDVPPVKNIEVSRKFLDDNWGTNSGQYQKAAEFSIDIPEGYYASKVIGYFDPRRGNHDATLRNMEATILIGGRKIDVPGYTYDLPIEEEFMEEKISDKLEVSLTSWDIGYYNFNFKVECTLLDATLETWQMETFNKIVQAYLDAKAQYDIAKAEAEATNSNNSLFAIDGSNPLYYREIEQTELKKNCIYMMAGKEAIGKEFTQTFMHDEIVPQNNLAYGKYASFSNFMEQSFDWKLMTYIFRPYFWADKSKWEKLFQLEDDDAIFKAFLQAGIAKVVVPVRLGFEKAVMHYLATGELWDGGDTPIINDELFISITDELQEQEGIVEGETWETRVPTSLTILQAQNAALSEGGLPCYCDGFEQYGLADGVDYDTVGEDNTVV